MTLAIALAQSNSSVGGLAANTDAILAARAAAPDADLIVTPELSVVGYPPEDLVLKPALIAAAMERVQQLAKATADGGPALLVGAPLLENGRLFNAAFLLDGGAITGVTRKHDLPNYGTFDEKRVFAAGPLPAPLGFRAVRLGVAICEDMWTPAVTDALVAGGAPRCRCIALGGDSLRRS